MLRVQVLVWGWAPWYRWKYRHIPGFSGLPFLGNVPDVVLHNGLVPLYRKAHKRFGRVFMVRRHPQTIPNVSINGCMEGVVRGLRTGVGGWGMLGRGQ